MILLRRSKEPSRIDLPLDVKLLRAIRLRKGHPMSHLERVVRSFCDTGLEVPGAQAIQQDVTSHKNGERDKARRQAFADNARRDAQGQRQSEEGQENHSAFVSGQRRHSEKERAEPQMFEVSRAVE